MKQMLGLASSPKDLGRFGADGLDSLIDSAESVGRTVKNLATNEDSAQVRLFVDMSEKLEDMAKNLSGRGDEMLDTLKGEHREVSSMLAQARDIMSKGYISPEDLKRGKRMIREGQVKLRMLEMKMLNAKRLQASGKVLDKSKGLPLMAPDLMIQDPTMQQLNTAKGEAYPLSMALMGALSGDPVGTSMLATRAVTDGLPIVTKVLDDALTTAAVRKKRLLEEAAQMNNYYGRFGSPF